MSFTFDSYEYIIVFKMVENPVFDLKIKHFLAVHGCGDEQFCVFCVCVCVCDVCVRALARRRQRLTEGVSEAWC